MDETLFTSGKVAAKLEIPRWQFLYLLEKGDLPGPSYEVPGRRLFTAHDFEQIKKAVDKRLRKDSSGNPDRRDHRHPAGQASTSRRKNMGPKNA